MKISKLFHWLYALLMLLPAFFVGGRCLYVIFNKNAKDSYSNSLQLTNELNVGETYYVVKPTTNNGLTTTKCYFTSVDFTCSSTQAEQTFNNALNNGLVSFIYNSSNLRLTGYNDTESEIMNIQLYSTTVFNIQFISAINRLDATGVYTLKNTLDNAFSYSMNELNENALFSWAKDSFLVEPFSYITGLFGIETGNPINTLLSYWLSISIIWLVFDLVMYVPLLVHRWLDKGVLE